jgi:uncharacterized membrane protein YqgA involved in biofilm formation
VPPGLGTLVNIVAILVGSAIGVALGDRLPERTRQVVTDGLGLVVLLVAALSASAVLDPALREATGTGAPVLIVLGSLLLGSIVGSLLRLGDRLEQVGGWLRRRLVRGGDAAGGHRFVEGFVTASLVFCVGPLAILGGLSDGLGTGIEQLVLKATLDGFASIAFAAALGWGVAASALAVLVYQGFWTILGLALGDLLPPAEIAAITATGGLLLVGVALRLLRLRDVPVADMLPALVVAPILTAAVAAFM